jgi:signal transduction histidine kinase
MRRCVNQECREPLTTGRRDRRTCSDACRSKIYRQEKERRAAAEIERTIALLRDLLDRSRLDAGGTDRAEVGKPVTMTKFSFLS